MFACLLGFLGFKMKESKPQWVTPPIGLRFEQNFKNAESYYNIPKGLLSYLAFIESSYRPDVVSHAGAVGLMQIVPRWHPTVDAKDPYDSIEYAAKYLHDLKLNLGTWKKALAAYNWGIGNVKNAIAMYGDGWLDNAPTETQNYIEKINQYFTV